MHGIELNIPDEAVKLRSEADGMIAEARAMMIETDADFINAGEKVKGIRKLGNQISDTFNPLIRSAHDHHRSLIKTRDTFLVPVELVENVLKKKIGEYQFKLDAQRREEERKRREEAMRRAEDEKLALAVKAEQSGNGALANRILEMPAMAPVVRMPEKARVEGISMRESWKFEIVDGSLLPREYLIPDEKKIGQIVRAMKGNTNISGVRVWSESSVAVAAG